LPGLPGTAAAPLVTAAGLADCVVVCKVLVSPNVDEASAGVVCWLVAPPPLATDEALYSPPPKALEPKNPPLNDVVGVPDAPDAVLPPPGALPPPTVLTPVEGSVLAPPTFDGREAAPDAANDVAALRSIDDMLAIRALCGLVVSPKVPLRDAEPVAAIVEVSEVSAAAAEIA
jgi:hypothetical protein